MICWLSNGEGPLGGRGSALQTACGLGGGGLDCEIKIWQGGGGAIEMTGLPKNCPAPTPQLINNDRPLKQLYNDNLRKLPNEYGDVSVMIFPFSELEQPRPTINVIL